MELLTGNCSLSQRTLNANIVHKIEHGVSNPNDITKTGTIEDNIGMYNNIFYSKFGHKPTTSQLASVGFGKPSINHSFTRDTEFDHILVIIYKSGLMGKDSISAVRRCHPLYDHLYKSLLRSSDIDFSSLRDEDENFESQMSIPCTRIVQTLSAALYYDLHIPSVIRYCGGTYLGQFRDVNKIIFDLKSILPTDLVREIERLYTIGAPRYFNDHSTRHNFWTYKRYGNHSSITKKPI